MPDFEVLGRQLVGTSEGQLSRCIKSSLFPEIGRGGCQKAFQSRVEGGTFQGSASMEDGRGDEAGRGKLRSSSKR